MIDAETAAKYIAIATAIGALLPFVQALIQSPAWSPKVKAVLTVVLSAVAAVVAYVVKNGFDFSDPLELAIWIIGIFGAAATSYSRLWRPTDLAPKLERATAKTGAKDGGGSDFAPTLDPDSSALDYRPAPLPDEVAPPGSVLDSTGHPTGQTVSLVDERDLELEELEDGSDNEDLLATDGRETLLPADSPIPTDFDDGRDPKYKGQ